MENIELGPEFMKWLETADYTGPISLTVKFYVKESEVSKFREIMKTMVEYSNSDHGALMYKLNEDFKDSTVFWLTEEWKSVADLKNHATDENHGKVGKMLGETLRAPPHVGLYKHMEL